MPIAAPFSLTSFQTFAITLTPGLVDHFTITRVEFFIAGFDADQFEAVLRTTMTDRVGTDGQGEPSTQTQAPGIFSALRAA